MNAKLKAALEKKIAEDAALDMLQALREILEIATTDNPYSKYSQLSAITDIARTAIEKATTDETE